MMKLGTMAPHFTLPNVIDPSDFELLTNGKIFVLMFLCNHCPYVVHVMPEIKRLASDYIGKSVQFVAISSNDAVAYPADGPEKMVDFFKNWSLSFPYLYDETQNVAKAYDAACTPDFYIFDAEHRLAYRGALDDSRPREINPKPLSGKYMRTAIEALLSNLKVPSEQVPSMGCNIKWIN